MKTYTFHISLPGYGRVWRKVEMAAEQTLQELHWAIQDAFDFDDDHLYSFFLSGKAWDQATEYRLPEGVDPWGLFSDDDEDDEEDEEDQELPIMDELIDREEEEAMLSSMAEIVTRLKSDPEFHRQTKEGMMKDLGLPEFLVDMILDRLSPMVSTLTPEMLDEIFSLEEEDEFAGDVRRTTLESLDLKVGKQFLYLFDYGDEWRFNVRVHAVGEDADPDTDYPLLVESIGEAPPQYPYWDEEDGDEDEDDAWDEEENLDEEE